MEMSRNIFEDAAADGPGEPDVFGPEEVLAARLAEEMELHDASSFQDSSGHFLDRTNSS